MKSSVKDKVNVLFIISHMVMGGAERLVHNIVARLDRSIFNPSIAWFLGDEILEEFRGLGVPLYHIPKKRRFDFNAMRLIGDIVRENKIDIINAHHFMPFIYSFYGSKIVNRRKLIYTEHAVWEIKTISLKWKKIGHYLLKYSDGVIGVSPTVSRGIQKIFNTTGPSTFSIQNGVDCGTFARSSDLGHLKKSLGIKEHEKVVGCVANFKIIKNHIFLVQAFCELIKEYQHLKLLLIGRGFEGDEEIVQELVNLVKEKGLTENVLFLGYRSDVPNLLSIMDVFCLTSFKEGLPISIIEAMAAGLPVVGTNVEGIRDVIIPNVNGFLVEIDDIQGLKNSLFSLLRDDSLRRRMGEESRKIAWSNYSLNRVISEYQNLFLSLLGK